MAGSTTEQRPSARWPVELARGAPRRSVHRPMAQSVASEKPSPVIGSQVTRRYWRSNTPPGEPTRRKDTQNARSGRVLSERRTAVMCVGVGMARRTWR